MVAQVKPEVRDALREEVREFLRGRPDLTYADLAQHTTLADTTLRLWVSGGIAGGAEVTRQIRRAIDQAKAGDILQPGGRQSVMLTVDENKRVRKVARAGKFWDTQAARKIWEVLDFCSKESAIGVVAADYGVGKTEAVREWRRRRAGKVESVNFEFDEFSSTNKVDFVRVMARQFGLAHDVGSQNGGLVFRDLCEYLRDNPCLLIFDQCETVRPRVFQVIRQIHDHTADAGVGVALLAAPILLERLTSGKMVDLGALTSRVAIWAALTGVTRAEMATIVRDEGFGPELVDDAAFELWWKATKGSMRRLLRSLVLLQARHAGKKVTERTIVGVAGNLWGMNVAGEAVS